MNSIRLVEKIGAAFNRRIYNLHPKAFIYDGHCRRTPNLPLTAVIDKDIEARVWPGDIIGKELYVRGLIEEAETRAIGKMLVPGMVFFDIGANLGFYSLLSAKKVGPTGQVHSFEPNPRIFQELLFNIKLNKFNNIYPNQIALSDHNGRGLLSSHERGEEVYGSLSDRNFPGVSIIGHDDVQLESLDSYIEKHGVNRIDFIKIDVEGAELDVLRGANNTLDILRPKNIMFELSEINVAGFGYRCIDVLSLLRVKGYGIYLPYRNGKLEKLNGNPEKYSGSPSFVARLP